LIFIDTGAWYATEVEDDENFKRASKFMKEELASNAYGLLVTCDYVLGETITLLRTRKGIKPALDFVDKIRASKSLQIVWIESDIFEEATKELSKYDDKKDQGLSFTDCVSFSIMNDLSIKNVFTFDAHFRKAGFNMLPQSSLANS
jgi:uncharacterized protein